MRIQDISACEILDSRGHPTVQAEVVTDSGTRGVARVPSGASTGSREARELRDGDPSRYRGRGVLDAVRNVTERIAPRLRGMAVAAQAELDRVLIELDGTADKSRLGANAILAVSLAAARAAAAERGMEPFEYLAGDAEPCMPLPMMNLLNGGAHAANRLDVQEFMVLPAGASSLREAIRYGAEIFHALRDILIGRGFSVAVGDEGGYAPDLPGNEAAIELLLEAVERAGLRAPEDVALALDVAATELLRNEPREQFSKRTYTLDRRVLDTEELIEVLADWTRRYPILSIEDGLAEDDWEGWRRLTGRLGGQVQLVGDDLFVTHSAILRRGIESGTANAILIKLNQVGTLSETLEAIATARQAGYAAIVSHRSGETEDTSIADLAVATATGQIKTGSLCRSERVAKYNRLMDIEDRLGARAVWPGWKALEQRPGASPPDIEALERAG